MRPDKSEQRGFRGTSHGWGADSPTESRSGYRTVDWDSSIIGFRLVSDCPVQHYRGGSWTWGDELATQPEGDVSIRDFGFNKLGIRLVWEGS